MSEDMPRLRIQIEGIRKTVMYQILEDREAIQEAVGDVVDEYITADGIKKVIVTEVQRQVRAALEDSIRHFFLYGSGRDDIDELVNNVFRAITKEE